MPFRPYVPLQQRPYDLTICPVFIDTVLPSYRSDSSDVDRGRQIYFTIPPEIFSSFS